MEALSFHPAEKPGCWGKPVPRRDGVPPSEDQACHPRRQFWRSASELMGRVSRQPSPGWSTRIRGLPVREVTADGEVDRIVAITRLYLTTGLLGGRKVFRFLITIGFLVEPQSCIPPSIRTGS